jgi:spermidine/putrescine transport system substrate-binding protein
MGSDIDTNGLDPSLLRGLTQGRISRRQLIRGTGAGLALLGVGSVLEACGVAGTKTTSSGEEFDWTAWWAKQKKQGVLDWANWPLYIDTENGKHESLELFTEKTGIKVNYKPVIQNNAPFYAQISPSLQAGQGIGYDLIVFTNGWQQTQMIENGWNVPLDQSRMPNFFKYAGADAKNPDYDPGNKYTVPWQSGLTGIAYNKKKIDRKIDSLEDLFDPAFKGKIGMMSDNTELGSVGLLMNGVDPVTSTPEQWKEAAELLTKQRDEGLVRQYYDQSYIKALEDGDTIISQAWSGDVFQANESGFPELEFVVPKEGVMIWHDNLSIPVHAQHPVDAMEWIDFYYQPKIAAIVEDWVNYLCPVPGAQKVIADEFEEPEIAESPLIFPTAAMRKKFVDYYTFKNVGEFEEWNSIFNPIIQS